MRLQKSAISLMLCAGFAVALPAASQPSIPSTTVTFKKGATSAFFDGKLQGTKAGVRDYVVRAGEGQKMTVELKTQSTSTHFNVLPPGSEEALYRGELTDEPRWTGVLPARGDYRVRVFLNRAAARQGKLATYQLRISVID